LEKQTQKEEVARLEELYLPSYLCLEVTACDRNEQVVLWWENADAREVSVVVLACPSDHHYDILNQVDLDIWRHRKCQKPIKKYRIICPMFKTH
jgi:hypothetical protein